MIMSGNNSVSGLHGQMKNLVKQWLTNRCLRIEGAESFLSEVPTKWQKHGDLVLFPISSFSSSQWSEMPAHFWEDLASLLKVKRLGLMGKTQSNGFRQPTVNLILGSDGWTEHTDNRVRYCFDVTRTMCSSGNITEKMRVAKFDCTGQIIVDLYAGIGYYTLPYLVHSKAAHVHACEWNPDAVIALHRGLVRNKVSDRCTVHEGDNSQAGLTDVADRINLGLLPTSKPGWSVACKALKAEGGFLHIHDCLNTKGQDRLTAEKLYCEQTGSEISELLTSIKADRDWEANVIHFERVKSYAPHITHIVLDLQCISRPRTGS